MKRIALSLLALVAGASLLFAAGTAQDLRIGQDGSGKPLWKSAQWPVSTVMQSAIGAAGALKTDKTTFNTYTSNGRMTDARFGLHSTSLVDYSKTLKIADVISKGLIVDVRAFANLSTAKASSETAGKTILVASATSINTATIPSDRAIKIEKGGSITVNSGKTLTINSTLSAGIFEVFPGSGSVVFGKIREIYPEWWNGDLAKAFASAASSNADVYLAGSYNISSPTSITLDDYFGIKGPGVITSTCPNTAGTSIIGLVPQSFTRIVLEDFTLSHTKANATDELLGGIIFTGTADSAYLKNIKVGGVPYYGIDVSASTIEAINVVAKDCTHAGASYGGGGVVNVNGGDYENNGNGSDNTTGYGLLLSGDTVTVDGVRANNNDRYGIDVRRGNKVSINNPYVFNSGLNGIYGASEDSEKDANNIRIKGGTVDNNSRVGSERGIWLGSYGASSTVSADVITVDDVTVKNTLKEGILVGTGTSDYNPERVTITKNKVFNCGATGGSPFASIAVGGGTKSVESVIVNENILKDSKGILANNTTYFEAIGNILVDHSGSYSPVHAQGTISVSNIDQNIVTGTGNTSPLVYSTAAKKLGGNNIHASYLADNSAVRNILKTGIVDNTATNLLKVTIPNASGGSLQGRLTVDYTTVDGDKKDNYRTGQIIVQFVRYPGAVAVASAATDSIAQLSTATASGFGITQTTAFGVTAVSGGATEDNIFYLQVTINTTDSSTGIITYSASFNQQGAQTTQLVKIEPQ